MGRFVLALDQGTTSSRSILFDQRGQPQAIARREFPQLYPRPGLVEHDPEAIWATQLETARKAVGDAGVQPDDLAAVGVTNQRETTILWERDSGRPIANAIVWQSRLTADLCARLKSEGLEPVFREKTGLVLDPYFSGTKIAWLLENVDGVRSRAERGEILFGTVDTFLIWRLTGGKVHVTDVSNASRTLLMNLQTCRWDDELLKLLNIPQAMLPEIRPSSGIVGETDQIIPGRTIPIAGVAGDQQAALFGQACFDVGSAKNTYGTGCFVLMNTGGEPVKSRHGLLSTVAWQLSDSVTYGLEGSVFIGGAVVQWLRDGLGMIESAEEVQRLAAEVPDTGDVYFVPAFVGLGAPYWDPEARGLIVGITRGTTRQHIARAALESIAWQTRDVLDAMQADAGQQLTELKADGGASANDLLMQRQADVLGVRVRRSAVAETTALGAAFLAGLATGVWSDESEIAGCWSAERDFLPQEDEKTRQAGHSRWKEAVRRCRQWAAGDESA